MKKFLIVVLILTTGVLVAREACGCCFENPCIDVEKNHQQVEKCVVAGKGDLNKCHEIIKRGGQL